MVLYLVAAAHAAAGHALFVGGVAGVDFHWTPPEARTIRGVPVLPTGGWTFDPAAAGKLWVGVHTAPLLLFTAGCSARGDVLGCTTTFEWVMLDLGWGVPIGGARGTVGPFVSAGLTAGEAGLRLGYVPRRVGIEARAAWAWPKGVLAAAAVSIHLGR